ncbi:MAG: metal ABC transporter substrate-binding protein [Candidatus Krumholzibacteria bacterium]|nr:metal ABC transporter substrate-binding protein [Candidatus Krumholzibacteria bacterium]
MKTFFISTIVAMVIGMTPLHAAPIKIAASIADLASIASSIGGDKVETFAIAKSTANPHYVEVLPSYMIMVSRAALYLKVGLALDQWADEIIDGSRNGRLLVVDCSSGISVLQKPSGKVDASMGDVHPEGNPHYWLDPSNGIVIAGNVLAALEKADPANRAYYEDNFTRFKAETEGRVAAWKERVSKLEGRRMLGYHSSWAYFAAAFDLTIAGTVEPLPGIPPTGKHLAELVDMIEKDGISILIQEPYFPDAAPGFLARETGIRVLKFAPSCDDAKPGSYLRHFDDIIDKIAGEVAP